MSALVSQPGLSAAKVLSIPKDWNAAWFRGLVQNMLQGGDVRNAIGANGISVSGNIASPYATITLGPGPVALTDPTAGTNTLTVSAPGANATSPGTNRALLLLGRANSYTAEIVGSSTSGQSYGLILKAGTTNADISLGVQNQAGTLDYLLIRGDGSGGIGYNGTATTLTFSPTGVISGYGPTAAAAVNMSPDRGTFTMTHTGFTAAQTSTCTWYRIGNVVLLNFGQTWPTGTSNATTWTGTGLPAAITPNISQTITVGDLEDSGAGVAGTISTISGSGTLTFGKGFISGGAWTAAGTKGFFNNGATTLCYLLN